MQMRVENGERVTGVPIVVVLIHSWTDLQWIQWVSERWSLEQLLERRDVEWWRKRMEKNDCYVDAYFVVILIMIWNDDDNETRRVEGEE